MAAVFSHSIPQAGGSSTPMEVGSLGGSSRMGSGRWGRRQEAAASLFYLFKMRIFFDCASDISVGRCTKNQATLEHHPGNLWCSNTAEFNDSTIGRFRNLSAVIRVDVEGAWYFKNLWGEIFDAQSCHITTRIFEVLQESYPARIFWKKWRELLGWSLY